MSSADGTSPDAEPYYVITCKRTDESAEPFVRYLRVTGGNTVNVNRAVSFTRQGAWDAIRELNEHSGEWNSFAMLRVDPTTEPDQRKIALDAAAACEAGRNMIEAVLAYLDERRQKLDETGRHDAALAMQSVMASIVYGPAIPPDLREGR